MAPAIWFLGTRRLRQPEGAPISGNQPRAMYLQVSVRQLQGTWRQHMKMYSLGGSRRPSGPRSLLAFWCLVVSIAPTKSESLLNGSPSSSVTPRLPRLAARHRCRAGQPRRRAGSLEGMPGATGLGPGTERGWMRRHQLLGVLFWWFWSENRGRCLVYLVV